jgi:hypothetical protein
MLTQAIVDAKALKEAAIKNAENLVIEKYASEIKEAVNSLLDEAPGDEVFDEDPLGLNAAEAVDPMEDPMGETPAGEQTPLDSVAEELPDSFKAAEGGQIEINLDQLSAEVTQAMGEMAAHEEAAEDMAAAPLQEPPSGQPTAPAPAAPMAENAEEEVNESDDEEITEDEEIDIDENNLLDILEKMIVDTAPTKSGWMNRSDEELQHEENLALAAAAAECTEEEVSEENEALSSELSETKRENKILASAGVKLQNENEKFRTAVIDLKESLERTNLSNAKLLYINQTLTNASLNERQKQRIVEAISATETVKEAKVIFETLQGTVGTLSNSKVSAPQSLSEAVSRKPSLMVAAGRKQQTTNNNSPAFDRMQRLAGIKN